MSVKKRFERLGRNIRPSVPEISLEQAYGNMRSLLATNPTWGDICRAFPRCNSEHERKQLESYLLDHVKASQLALTLESEADSKLLEAPSGLALAHTKALHLKDTGVSLNETRTSYAWASLEKTTLSFLPVDRVSALDQAWICPFLADTLDLTLEGFMPARIGWSNLWGTLTRIPSLEHLTLFASPEHIDPLGFWEGMYFGRGLVRPVVAPPSLKTLTLNCGRSEVVLHRFKDFFTGVSFPHLEKLVLYTHEFPDKRERSIRPSKRVSAQLPQLREIVLVGTPT